MSDYHKNYADQADVRIKDLEAKNAELEKKLEIAVEALNFYSDKSNYQGSPSRIDMQDNGEKAREVIKMLGNYEGDK